MVPGEARTRAGRAAAEQALVRVVHHYGGRPEFVVLGGLVPELLCGKSDVRHAGTTDVDVQVDLEISTGSANLARLEEALRNAEFASDGRSVWRWVAAATPPGTGKVVVKNDGGGANAAAEAVRTRFGGDLASVGTALDDLRANFATVDAQGPLAYVDQMLAEHPELDADTLATDAVLAVETFHHKVLGT